MLGAGMGHESQGWQMSTLASAHIAPPKNIKEKSRHVHNFIT